MVGADYHSYSYEASRTAVIVVPWSTSLSCACSQLLLAYVGAHEIESHQRNTRCDSRRQCAVTVHETFFYSLCGEPVTPPYLLPLPPSFLPDCPRGVLIPTRPGEANLINHARGQPTERARATNPVLPAEEDCPPYFFKITDRHRARPQNTNFFSKISTNYSGGGLIFCKD